MAGKLTRSPGTKGVARYNHTDMTNLQNLGSTRSISSGGGGAHGIGGGVGAGMKQLSVQRGMPTTQKKTSSGI